MLVAAERAELRGPASSHWRGIGGSFWSDPLGEISKGINNAASDWESDIRHGLSDAETDMRHGLSEFESKNREGLQLAYAGAGCAVGSAYLGPGAAPLVCAPMNALLGVPGSPGVLVDPNNPNDPGYANAQQYLAENPWITPGKSIAAADAAKGLGLFALIALAIYAAMKGRRR